MTTNSHAIPWRSTRYIASSVCLSSAHRLWVGIKTVIALIRESSSGSGHSETDKPIFIKHGDSRFRHPRQQARTQPRTQLHTIESKTKSIVKGRDLIIY